MDFKYKSLNQDDSELEITSFMNLMIVLIPVLLLSMTFTQIRVLEVNLPVLTGGAVASADAQSDLEVRVEPTGFKVLLDEQLVQEIPLKELNTEMTYDFNALALLMQAVKQQLSEKKDILVISTPDIKYQTLVFTMDAVKSYKTVVAASVVEIELFPEISLGDTTVLDH